MKSASEKQMEFADLINAFTYIPLPSEKTASAYWKYIQENIEQYNICRAKTKKFERGLRAKCNFISDDIDMEQDSSWAAAMDFSWM